MFTWRTWNSRGFLYNVFTVEAVGLGPRQRDEVVLLYQGAELQTFRRGRTRRKDLLFHSVSSPHGVAASAPRRMCDITSLAAP